MISTGLGTINPNTIDLILKYEDIDNVDNFIDKIMIYYSNGYRLRNEEQKNRKIKASKMIKEMCNIEGNTKNLSLLKEVKNG